MTKLVVIPNSLEMLDLKCDAFIFGIKDLSVNLPFYIEIEELKKIINKIKDKEIFIALNKNMHNSDLEKLKKTLIELNKLNIKAVMYYDISIVNLYHKLKLNYDLVWNQEHLTTNYMTVNYWYEKGVKYTCLSSEITLSEIKEIIKNTGSKLMLPLFGYIPMFTSKRHAIKNYADYFKIEKKEELNYILKENKTYPVVDDKLGTVVYSNNILNGIKEYLEVKNKIDYVILNSFLIKKDEFEKTLEMFNNITEKTKDEYFDKINSIFTYNTSTYFLHKPTIYKVKKND